MSFPHDDAGRSSTRKPARPSQQGLRSPVSQTAREDRPAIFSGPLSYGRMWSPRAARTRSYAARLDRYRRCAGLYRPFVRDRELWRSDATIRPPGSFAALHLSAFARDLLHLMDVLRVGGTC